MQFLNTLLAIFLASLLVSASPLGRSSNEKRQADDIVCVTVTSTSMVTLYTHMGAHVTKIVTVHHSFGEPPQQGDDYTPTHIAPAVAAVETPPSVSSPAAVETPQEEASPTTPEAAPAAPAASPSPAAESPAANAPTGTVYSGQGTFYGTGLGSCGITSTDTDYICAISEILYDSLPDGGNPNKSPWCGKQITASRGGNSVTVTVVDRCTGCRVHDLDFSPSGFDQLATPAEGRVDITWEFS